MSGFAGAYGVHKFMAFFNDIFAKGNGSLRPVPGASAFRIEKFVHHTLNVFQCPLFLVCICIHVHSVYGKWAFAVSVAIFPSCPRRRVFSGCSDTGQSGSTANSRSACLLEQVQGQIALGICSRIQELDKTADCAAKYGVWPELPCRILLRAELCSD